MTAIIARRSFGHLVLMPLVLTFALGLFGTAEPAHAGELINAKGGVAIQGYDPVAYFTEGGAVKGSEQFAHQWLGATWHFTNAKHRDLFAASPTKYAPQYGGLCSRGMRKGGIYAADPTVWRIVDGKLYLFYSHKLLVKWEQDIPGQIAQGDASWQKLKAGPSQ